MYDLGIINGEIYRNQTLTKHNVYISDGKIQLITTDILPAVKSIDATDKYVLPGLIDPHVHFDLDLGWIRSRDNFEVGSRAAIYGGITTIIDFLDPIDHEDQLEDALHMRLDLAKKCRTDFKFHATIKNPTNHASKISEKMLELGLNSIKLFTTYSDSLRRTYDQEIKELLRLSKQHDFLVLAHIENDDLIVLNDSFTYRDLPISRPTISETSEALKLASFAKETEGNLYMVHCSSGETLYQLAEQYSDILNINFYVESCPHYFSFSNTILQEPDGYLYTMAPPLRSEEEVKLLHQQFQDVYTIGTDHCSFFKKDKLAKTLKTIPLGIGGVEHSFLRMYEMFGIHAIDKMSLNVAKAHKLYPQKGIIQVGSDADIFIFDPLYQGVIDQNHSAVDYTVYQGFKQIGAINTTIIRGTIVLENQTLYPHKGQYLGGSHESNH